MIKTEVLCAPRPQDGGFNHYFQIMNNTFCYVPEMLTLTTEPSETSVVSAFHVHEMLTLTTDPSGTSVDSAFHVHEMLTLTTDPSGTSVDSAFHVHEMLILQ